MAEDLVLVHGFAGTHRSWDLVLGELGQRYRPVAIDLPVESLEAAVQAVLDACEGPFAICGYSMGARIALQAALAAPERVTRLVLVSGTAGIEDERERAERAASDEQLAQRIESETIEQFADRWQTLPIFAGTELGAAEEWRHDITRNEPGRLARMLRTTGPGKMPSAWNRLGELTMPTTIVVGERDTRYLEIGRRLVEQVAGAELVVIAGAGHGLPREAPIELAAAIA